MFKVNVFELVGKNAISMQSGKKINEIISPVLLKGETVELNFEGVSLYASPFFNASIGLLLKDIAIEDLRKSIKFININDIGRSLLNNVVQNAINFYSGNRNVSDALDKNEEDK
jgi:hypothetical protein